MRRAERIPNFGSNDVPALLNQLKFDPNLQTGFGKRGYNWEFSAGVQQQLAARVSIDVGFFRRWYGNFQVVDNLALSASDFNFINLQAPADSRLPGGGNYTVTGFPVVKPTAGVRRLRPRTRTSSSCPTMSAGRSSTGTAWTSTSTPGCRTASSPQADSAPGARRRTTATSSLPAGGGVPRATISSARTSSRRYRRSSASRTACSSRRSRPAPATRFRRSTCRSPAPTRTCPA